MSQTIWHKGKYSISTDKKHLSVATIHSYLAHDSYWAAGIPLDVVEKSIAHSFCFGLYLGNPEVENAQQVGFARVITDHATFAWLADVFVLPEHRGQGLSKWMVQLIVDHPDLQGLRRFMLGTQDAHGLYTRFGFQPLAHPERWLAISRGTSVYNS